MQAATDWIAQNYIVILLVLWALASIVPRPHPDDKDGFAKYLWLVIDRVSLLTNERLGGKVKLPLAGSPTPDKKAAPAADAEQGGSASKDDPS